MKRLLSLFLILSLLLLLSLVGCNEGTTPQVTTESPTPSDTAESTESSDSTDSQESTETPDSTEITDSSEPAEATDSSELTESSEGTEPTEPIDHFDEDDNGVCDDCGISVIVVLDIFAINDLHGKLCDSSAQIGVDEMTTYLKRAYNTEDHVLILSSGDMWQGSSESNLTRGMIVTEWMNELDFVSMTLGNHEFDWGEEYIENNAEIAEFPFLAINIYDRDSDKLVEYCTPSVLVERGGATIGIIGAIGDCYSSISGEYSGGVYFKTGNELTNLVKAEATRLREAGADFIIYSIHDGHGQSYAGTGAINDGQLSSYYAPILSDGYVNIVFEGHTHRSYVLRDGKGVYHLQNGGDNSGVSYAEAVINFANGNSKVQNAKFIRPTAYESLPDDPIVEELLEKYDDQVSIGTQVLGINAQNRSGDELRQLVADLYLKAGLEAFGDEYNIVLGGGFISVRSPGYLAAGEVVFSQLQGLFPFENQLVLCSVKGRDLLSKFINTSNSNYFISYSEFGEQIKDNIDPNATYYIITDTYCSQYAPNRLTEIKRYEDGIYAQQLLADHIASGGLSNDEK